jgi:hypothetical protein
MSNTAKLEAEYEYSAEYLKPTKMGILKDFSNHLCAERR